ncbi:MAG: tRNA (adenosine(37)-N6)-dimethylallyltransferase MiaA, partial [Flavobacteriales bacterium]|nr:tRNA (adenosine(37)-N6)-dimethylallyltransferase MiaA [Flavobacteriales bacterium]
ASAFNCPILSADSRQFFLEMNIGTAKPTEDELRAAEHHFVNFLSIHDEYSAGHFERDVMSKLKAVFGSHDVAILVGGSGLYVNAILYGFDELPADSTIRNELVQRAKNEGVAALFKELSKLDPTTGEQIDSKNTQRVIRALEVCLVSGKPYSSFRTNTIKPRPFNTEIIGLSADREVIYKRINQRVDKMFEEGLEDEARQLLPFRNLNALKTVGYRELFQYFDGEISRDEAIEQIKKNTRNFAKRQLTWFKREPSTKWFDISENHLIHPYLRNKVQSE